MVSPALPGMLRGSVEQGRPMLPHNYPLSSTTDLQARLLEAT